MYPISVSGCPGPECGIFCILIVDLIFRSALVLFSLLLARNYHYNKGTLKLKLFKWKTINIRLLHIVILQSIFLRRVIKIVLIYIIVRYTWRSSFDAIIHWPKTLLLFLLYYIINCHGKLLLSQILNLLFLVFPNTTFLQTSKKSIKFDFNQQQQVHTSSSWYPNQATTERQIIIGGQMFVVW